MEISKHRRRNRALVGAGLLAIVGAALLAGWDLRSSPRAGRPVLYYVDPMHPAYRSDKPGKAPDCGMDLEPVYAASPAPTLTTPGQVHLSREQEDAIQLETETIEVRSVVRRVQTAGRVVPIEALTYDVSAGVDGWIRNTWNDETGSPVSRDQKLASFYSRDVSAPQQAYLYALESYNKLGRSAANADQLALAAQQLSNARDNLQFAGLQSSQIDELGRLRRETPVVLLKSPCTGQILERNVAAGKRFMRGEVLYRIADVSRVWVLADVTANDELLAQSVMRAQVRLQGLPPLAATVVTVLPRSAAEGRTAKLRLQVDNKDRNLVPGMVVDVSLETSVASAMTLSAGAVLDSGTQKRVFVALGSGGYELRAVETGWQYEDRIEIIRGLAEGERVVTAGAFLLDSESRMKTSAAR